MTATPIGKNELENIDLLQMEYFSDFAISKKDVIVIEPSNPIAITIRKFLSSLGYENIHICKDTDEAIKIFSDFINNEISVPIIIDDNISDQNLKNIVKNVLEIQPSVKIIIITTKEKTDPYIIDLFNMGIMSITPKPLDLMELKKSLSGIFEKTDNWKNIPMEEKLEILLSSHKIISKKRIKSILNADQTEIERLLEKRKEGHEIIVYKEVLEAACNQCKSPNITYNSKCPTCKQINFKQKTLIEHYSCGAVFPKEIDSTICPKCNKDIGFVGKDYHEILDHYICKSCDDRFPRPSLELICLECGNIFVEGTIQWEKDTLYQVTR